MPAYYDAAISGDGQASLSGNSVVYLLCQITTVGGGVRELDSGSPDHILRAGWLSLGDNVPVFAGAGDFWRLPIFLDFVSTLWTPIGSGVGGGPVYLQATLVRWHISVGSVAHLYVFGL